MKGRNAFRLSLRTLAVLTEAVGIALGAFVWVANQQPLLSVSVGKVGGTGMTVVARSWHPRYGSQCVVIVQRPPSSFYLEPYLIGYPHNDDSVEVVRQGVFVYGKQLTRWDRSCLVVVSGPEDERVWREIAVPDEVLQQVYVDGSRQVVGLDDYLQQL
jgi:hypothetical protein